MAILVHHLMAPLVLRRKTCEKKMKKVKRSMRATTGPKQMETWEVIVSIEVEKDTKERLLKYNS